MKGAGGKVTKRKSFDHISEIGLHKSQNVKGLVWRLAVPGSRGHKNGIDDVG